MSTPQIIIDWLARAPGRAMNPDGHYGLQCVDLVDQYAQDIFGVPWPQSVGGVSGARQLLDRVPDAYWIRTDNNSANPNLIPSRGDVVVFGGSAINTWGHTAVVDTADTKGMWVVQQDGFAAPLVWVDGSWYSSKPAHRIWLPYYSNGTGPITGWLTPRREKLKAIPSSNTLAKNQRITAASVNQRTTASRSGSVVKTFPAETILDFKGYVRGESVDGNNIWFVGAYSTTYFWSGGFHDKGTHDLADLTPAPKPAPAPAPAPTTTLLPTQRKAAAAVRYRKAPNTSAEVIIEYKAGDVLNFSKFTRGESVDGNNIWFKGALTAGYAWSGAFENKSTTGLTEEIIVSPSPAPTPTPTPAKYTFTPDFDFVEVIPAALPNFMPGNFPEKPEKVVIHQFGTLGVDTLNSTINTFTHPALERVASAHFVVSGKRIIQMVSLKDRAYHAGAVGNNYVGIETDPAQDADTIASTKKLLIALKEKYGYELVKILHKDVSGNSTNCGASITLSKYDLDPVVVIPPANPTPVPVPVPEPTPVPVPALTEESIIDAFLAFLKSEYFKNK